MSIPPIVSTAETVIIGAGIAGASTAAALARAGMPSGLILEREPIPGSHASGKNAGIACLTEFDPVVRALSIAGVRELHRRAAAGVRLIEPGYGLYLGGEDEAAEFEACVIALRSERVDAMMLSHADAVVRFPFLAQFSFGLAVCTGGEGVIDIHALLLDYLEEARRGGFTLMPRTEVLDLHVEGGRAAGVVTPRGTIGARLVVDASGAWAGRLGRRQPLALQPVRRHLFVSASAATLPHDTPMVWHVGDGYYLRPEGEGLLLSPCDETPHDPGVPAVDPSAAQMLAGKLLESAPALADLPIRSAWACLRTFAPDRRPVIGFDPVVEGLFHVAGLGGFGMGTSWAVGEVAAALIGRRPVPFIDPEDVAPERLGRVTAAGASRPLG